MVEVKFYDHAEDALLKFAVILARTGGKWVFCRHRGRDKRELREETGAVEFTIRPVCAYSVRGKTGTHKSAEEETFGMLFMADITSFEALHCEIEAILVTDRPVDRWTYPLIQPRLLAEARNRGFW